MRALLGAAAWTSPVLLAALAARVGEGAADSPLLVVAAVVAPLAALLRRGAPDVPGGAGALLRVAIGGLLLWANVLVFAEVAALLGAERWHGAAVAGATLLLLGLRRAGGWWHAAAVGVGLVLLLLPLAALATRSGTMPWTAWTAKASRLAPLLGAQSSWVTRGERFPRDAVLDFTEGHRLTVLTAGTYRVVERDGTRVVVREWQLDAGDTLALRPGDRLAVHAGARIRFEAGKRVPGAAPSGVASAGPPERRRGEHLLAWTGAAITLLGGAIALLPPARRVGGASAVAAPALVVVAALVAVGWGVYAAALAPEVTVGGSVATIVHLPAALDGGAAGRALGLVACAGLLALLGASGAALRGRLAGRAGDGSTRLWIALVVGVAALGAVPVDPWRVLVAGLGLGASAGAGPLLAPGDRAARTAGVVVGAAVFGGLALAPPLAGPLGALAAWPALLAAPMGWAVTTLVARARRGFAAPVSGPRWATRSSFRGS